MRSTLPRTLLAALLATAALGACSATTPDRTAAAPNPAVGATAVEVENAGNRDADIYARIAGGAVLLGQVARDGRATFPLPAGQRVDAVFAKRVGTVPSSTDQYGDHEVGRVKIRYVRGD
jgi:hypothetical protein